jgi:CheY-like chemotaxis protein
MSDKLLRGKRYLVLDDEFLIALDIQQILELAGAMYVASVATASEAIALVRREPKFDLAVLDVKLSGAGGEQPRCCSSARGKGDAVRLSDRNARRQCAR